MAVTATPSPDAGLIYLCERIVRRDQRINRTYDRGYDAASDRETKAALLDVFISQRDVIDDMIEAVAGMRATTPEGLAAKAEVMRVWVGVYRDDHTRIELNGTATAHERLAWSLADDLAGIQS